MTKFYLFRCPAEKDPFYLAHCREKKRGEQLVLAADDALKDFLLLVDSQVRTANDSKISGADVLTTVPGALILPASYMFYGAGNKAKGSKLWKKVVSYSAVSVNSVLNLYCAILALKIWRAYLDGGVNLTASKDKLERITQLFKELREGKSVLQILLEELVSLGASYLSAIPFMDVDKETGPNLGGDDLNKAGVEITGIGYTILHFLGVKGIIELVVPNGASFASALWHDTAVQAYRCCIKTPTARTQLSELSDDELLKLCRAVKADYMAMVGNVATFCSAHLSLPEEKCHPKVKKLSAAFAELLEKELVMGDVDPEAEQYDAALKLVQEIIILAADEAVKDMPKTPTWMKWSGNVVMTGGGLTSLTGYFEATRKHIGISDPVKAYAKTTAVCVPLGGLVVKLTVGLWGSASSTLMRLGQNPVEGQDFTWGEQWRFAQALPVFSEYPFTVSAVLSLGTALSIFSAYSVDAINCEALGESIASKIKIPTIIFAALFNSSGFKPLLQSCLDVLVGYKGTAEQKKVAALNHFLQGLPNLISNLDPVFMCEVIFKQAEKCTDESALKDYFNNEDKVKSLLKQAGVELSYFEQTDTLAGNFLGTLHTEILRRGELKHQNLQQRNSRPQATRAAGHGPTEPLLNQ